MGMKYHSWGVFFILYSSLPFHDSRKQTSNISGLALNMAGPEGRHDQKDHPVENSLDGDG